MKASITFGLALATSFLLGFIGQRFASPVLVLAAQTTTPSSNADKALLQAMMSMNHSMMSAKMTGSPDQDFMRMMIPHHQSAIDMARVELRYGNDTRVRALATNIIAAQQKEIIEMRNWLNSSSY